MTSQMVTRSPVAHDRVRGTDKDQTPEVQEELQGLRQIPPHISVGRCHSPATDGQNACFLCAVIEGTNDRIDLGQERPVEQEDGGHVAEQARDGVGAREYMVLEPLRVAFGPREEELPC
ncbi:hypothetical protein PG988_006711 [Apiospora saccharicola]